MDALYPGFHFKIILENVNFIYISHRNYERAEKFMGNGIMSVYLVNIRWGWLVCALVLDLLHNTCFSLEEEKKTFTR